MWHKYLLAFATLFTLSQGQRITTIQLDGIQYFISRMNPYTPELNWFMAYQYCRSIGLQLTSFESREKSDSITQYLTNAGYNKYDFWTSGNRIGTDMFLWMSTGLPFNATFNLMKSQEDNQPLLGTMPLGRKKRLDSGISDACVALKSPDLIWDTEDCTSIKDFICEQTRCYYYNYGSIPVSSSQGNKSTASASNTRLYSTPLPLLSTTAYPSSTFSSTAHFYNEHVTESSTDEETSSDDYFNENNYVRILNNYRKVVDEEVSRTEGSAPEVTVPIKEKSKEAAKKTEEAPKDAKESLKEGLNKRSGEAEAPKDGNLVKDAVKDMKDPKRSGETKVANNRMELKESLMKSVQGKVPKPAGINKNLYKKTGGDGMPRKPLDELRRTTEQYVSVATTEYFDTEEERKSLEELSSKVAEGVKKGESNELPKGNAEKVKAGVPAPTPTTINLHSKTSENIINSIRNIMNNTHHLKQGLSEIHDAQIIVKADPKVGKKDAKTPEAKTSEAPTKINEASAKINEASPTALERLDNAIVARSGEDEKTRLRNTKVLEPTENDARAMPENLSAAFPWSWAKDILLEKPVAKKTAPNVEDIIAETTDSV